MKKQIKAYILTFLTIFFTASITTAQDAESTGYPGDNFSLEGALELFKKADSPEAFEKMLNAEDNHINNLDLNDDNEIDYVRVIDNMDGDVHAIVLQVFVSEDESQDIAVIEIEKTGKDEAILQILGDEDVFGDETIVEPFEAATSEDGKNGPNITVERIVVNVWGWPSVRFVYAPGYRAWVSPYRWRHYPVWFSPWRPHPFHVWHPYVVNYRPHYHVVTTHRVTRAHAVYAPRRTGSKTVRTHTTVVKTRKGTVKKSTTTTTKRGPKGQVKSQKKTTTVKGKRRGG
ncbi:MAG: hypothetical protein K9J37_15740 [Saprospiraceae bacterium]|nr:hypothetical protein [Saprospiraceae bacterium]MCF8251364.1 hypothetical protein [Saprospiraceae bacterium]MCF8280539.1 hypothetical protein [Bacteroidales bacterium]MCF8313243.1 hypothetical protein [Saprospiraceae bacterium]MCF8441690.1 hypothetical protein [Saprospiraceae bacterium]